MNSDMEFLEYIYKNSEMMEYTLKKLDESLEDKDNKIKKIVKEEIKISKEFKKETKRMIKKNNYDLCKNSLKTKLMASFGINKEVECDNSDSHIAKILTQGLTMGKVEIESKLNNYDESCDEDIISIANKYLKFCNDEIEKLKIYL